ncbi:MAG: hypothetical protein QT03_C0001G0070 [archaeon GW2011_AR10]|nr:MAG: hypothetical protein QT03_C0001G0070 [archaeon GW2011_AR10]
MRKGLFNSDFYKNTSNREQIRQRALQRLKKGYLLGKLLYKNRADLYDR